MKHIRIIEVKSELGAGTRGASLGVDAIKIASVNAGSDLFTKLESHKVRTNNSSLFHASEYPWAKRIKDILQLELRTCEAVEKTISKYFPIILGGDHSTAAGVIMGVKKAFPDKRIGVVWIDAHADLHTPYTSPSGNMHGMPLAMCLGINNMEEQMNTPNHAVIQAWEDIKHIGGAQPKIIPEDIVFIALRDTEEPENALIKKYRMKVFSVKDVTEKTAETVANESMEYLSKCDLICVSFDVDSMDTSVSMGTGTPVPGGLSLEQAKQLNQAFIKQPKVASWEMVEVNPTLDSKNKMAEAAFEVLKVVVEARG